MDGLAPDCSLGEPVLGVTGLSPWVSDVEEIFMQESDALNFLKKCSKRSPRFQDEVNGKTLWPAFCSCSFSLPVSWALVPASTLTWEERETGYGGGRELGVSTPSQL